VVERQGRVTAFTPDGQTLLTDARRILAAHDDALRRLIGPDRPIVTIGTTEHAAELILPAVTAALPGHEVRFRIDRTRRLDAAVDQGVIDVAVHLAEASSAEGTPIGSLPLAWYAATGWEPPGPGRAWPLVAIEEPCVLRRRAVAALDARGLDAYVVCDSGYVAGVFDAVRAGLGVALMATPTSTPEGLSVRNDLPAVEPAAVNLRARPGGDPGVARAVGECLRTVLA
jgi:DNA-binding transcriptional LysR family regulator